ncbi:hypothetical protein ORI89_17290 [Sphingobacterium sp. UT-1RO-CII-1]|uniref:hypothetical protein n=1 Tax=Sphingobacterium sp. UT-1RO-CII-1 TaxID=2995225 RepID=UPI00227BEFC6|nr:hypothetical protein [Sphingobacterium sp. UT-1RO-CII-1]MCY4781417.1 hypothetical protein [Sphingobacterium sp. UT-1RO-CII-1]
MNKFKTINTVEPELVSLMNEAAELGAMRALMNTGNVTQYITKSAAYKRIGSRTKVDKWIEAGVLKVCAAGIDLSELLAIAASANLATYMHNKVLK